MRNIKTITEQEAIELAVKMGMDPRVGKITQDNVHVKVPTYREEDEQTVYWYFDPDGKVAAFDVEGDTAWGFDPIIMADWLREKKFR